MRVATVVQPLVDAAIGSDLPVRVDCWDGGSVGPPDADMVVRFVSPRALRRLVWASTMRRHPPISRRRNASIRRSASSSPTPACEPSPSTC